MTHIKSKGPKHLAFLFRYLFNIAFYRFVLYIHPRDIYKWVMAYYSNIHAVAQRRGYAAFHALHSAGIEAAHTADQL
jgi:hypothetical protein